MRVLRNIYDFVTGGSIASVAGVALAIVALVALPLPGSIKATILALVILATLVASTYEPIE